MNRGTQLWEGKAKRLIPGGSQLLSKRAEMFLPEQWPSYFDSADGVRVVDLDGNVYLDMSIMGVGACILGYGHDRVDERVTLAIQQGTMTTLNAPEEVELAERLVALHPWADMVRFARTGGEAMTIAVRLARAYSGRDPVAFCGYHGWHDWYLAANLAGTDRLDDHLLPGLDPSGVPKALEGTAHPFEYNDAEALEQIVNDHDLGAIVMEPVRNVPPDEGFLKRVREIANANEIPLVFDEITSGFRVRVGGAHETYDVTPDVVVYGKALGNGYPVAAVVGRGEIMDMAQESFISSTFWTERIGSVAALATLDVLEEESVPEHLTTQGERLQEGLSQAFESRGIQADVVGLPSLTHFSIDEDLDREAKTLFTQEMLEQGYLAGDSIYLSFAHDETIVDQYLDDASAAIGVVAETMANGSFDERLEGPIAHSKFERLN